MTIVDARAATDTFDMSDGEMVNNDVIINLGMVFYGWETSGGDAVYGPLDGGLVSPIQIDLDYVNDSGADATITPDSPVAVGSLTSPGGTNAQVAADKFWTTLLAGNDRLYAAENGRSFLFGDFLTVFSDASATEERTGGDDIITAAATSGGGLSLGIGGGGGRGGSGPWLVGDAYQVLGSETGGMFPIAYVATLTGGNDRISVTNIAANDMAGDAFSAGLLGDVIGGDDVLRSDGVLTSFGLKSTRSLVGDVVLVTGGFVDGGNDDLTGSDFSFLDEALAGDVFRQETGQTTGGDDRIDGRGGHDFIGGDAIIAAALLTGGDDDLHGGDDADIIAGDVIQVGNGGPFGDFGAGGAVAATIACGDDVISGDDGADIIAGDIYALGGLAGGSSIQGGKDTISGGNGRDRLFGDFGDGAGPSLNSGTVTLGGDADKLNGGGGDDFLAGQFGKDILNGGSGTDTADYSEKTVSVKVTLDGSHVVSVKVGGANEDSIKNIENINGGADADQLTGDEENNRLDGGGGDNSLNGKDGADTLVGGGGSDEMKGGAGADTFLFNAVLGDGTFDTISDFQGADRIVIDNAAFAALATGALAGAAFAKGSGANAAHDSDDRIIYDTATGKLYYDADGVGGAAAEQFAKLTGHPSLSAADFLVV